LNSAITIRLDEKLNKMLTSLCNQTGRSRSEIVRIALKRQLSVLMFEQLREKTMPFAESASYLTDDDIYKDIS